MKKLHVMLILGVVTISGCALFNGSNDLPYDVSLSLHLPSGEFLDVVYDDDGLKIEGEVRGRTSGTIYRIDEDGTLSAEYSDGNVITLTPKE